MCRVQRYFDHPVVYAVILALFFQAVMLPGLAVAQPSSPSILWRGEDASGDGKIDTEETDPNDPESHPEEPAVEVLDSDGDGLFDNFEIAKELNYLLPDTDHDGINDYDEIYKYYTKPNDPDTDGDGAPDGLELGLTSTGQHSDGSPMRSGENEYNEAWYDSINKDLTFASRHVFENKIDLEKNSYFFTKITGISTFIPSNEYILTDPLNRDSNYDTILDGEHYNYFANKALPYVVPDRSGVDPNRGICRLESLTPTIDRLYQLIFFVGYDSLLEKDIWFTEFYVSLGSSTNPIEIIVEPEGSAIPWPGVVTSSNLNEEGVALIQITGEKIDNPPTKVTLIDSATEEIIFSYDTAVPEEQGYHIQDIYGIKLEHVTDKLSRLQSAKSANVSSEMSMVPVPDEGILQIEMPPCDDLLIELAVGSLGSALIELGYEAGKIFIEVFYNLGIRPMEFWLYTAQNVRYELMQSAPEILRPICQDYYLGGRSLGGEVLLSVADWAINDVLLPEILSKIPIYRHYQLFRAGKACFDQIIDTEGEDGGEKSGYSYPAYRLSNKVENPGILVNSGTGSGGISPNPIAKTVSGAYRNFGIGGEFLTRMVIQFGRIDGIKSIGRVYVPYYGGEEGRRGTKGIDGAFFMKEGNKVICVGYEVKSSAELSDPVPREDRVGTPDEARPAQPGRLRDGAYGYTQATPNDFLRSHYQSITNATSVGQNGGALGLSANEIKRQAAEAGAHDMVKMIEGMELLKQGINDYAKQVIKGKDTDTVIQQKRKDFIRHVTNFSNKTDPKWGSDPAWTHFDKFLAKSNHPRAAEMRKGFHSVMGDWRSVVFYIHRDKTKDGEPRVMTEAEIKKNNPEYGLPGNHNKRVQNTKDFYSEFTKQTGIKPTLDVDARLKLCPHLRTVRIVFDPKKPKL